MGVRLQETALEAQGHWCFGIDDHSACVRDIHVEDGFSVQSSGNRAGAEGCDEPRDRCWHYGIKVMISRILPDGCHAMLGGSEDYSNCMSMLPGRCQWIHTFMAVEHCERDSSDLLVARDLIDCLVPLFEPWRDLWEEKMAERQEKRERWRGLGVDNGETVALEMT